MRAGEGVDLVGDTAEGGRGRVGRGIGMLQHSWDFWCLNVLGFPWIAMHYEISQTSESLSPTVLLRVAGEFTFRSNRKFWILRLSVLSTRSIDGQCNQIAVERKTRENVIIVVGIL